MAIGATTTRVRARTPGGQAPTGPDTSWMRRGDDARQRAEAEIARQRAEAERRQGPRVPFRFFTKVGEPREIIVLDSEIGWCFYEHQLQNSKNGKWELHEPCPKEFEPCPICTADENRGGGWGRESNYLMFLTVAELSPWTDKDGNVHNYSIRLLAVKAAHHGFFIRLHEREGTLRGAHLLMARDTKQVVNHGVPEFLSMESESDIMETFGHDAITDDNGKVVKEANADCFPVDYTRIFRRPSAEDIRTRYNIDTPAPAGSRAARRNEWGDSEPASGGAQQGGQAASQGVRGRGIAPRTGISARTSAGAATASASASAVAGGGDGDDATGEGDRPGSDLNDEIPF